MAVPGELKGYFEAKKRFGNPNITMKSLMDPVIKMCKEGIRTTRSLARATAKTMKWIQKDKLMR